MKFIFIESKSNLIKFSCLSIVFSYKLPGVSSKNLHYTIFNSIGQIIYQSEDKSDRKIFAFSDAYIQKFNDGDKIYNIIIYEKDTIIGETKNFTLKTKNTDFPIFALNSNKDIAKLNVKYSKQKRKTMLDHLQLGLKIKLGVAIDYTSSNLNPSNPSSLHYLREKNQYMSLFKGFAEIIDIYSKDNMIEAYGFGGMPKGTLSVSHCFNMNSNITPFVDGIDGLVEAYKKSLSSVTLFGPTLLNILIKNNIEIIKKVPKEKKEYKIFVIIVDGLINDVMETLDILIESSKYPLSVIIIGVGDDYFDNMEKLCKLVLI